MSRVISHEIQHWWIQELGFKESLNTLPGSVKPELAHYGQTKENISPLLWMGMQVKLNDVEEM